MKLEEESIAIEIIKEIDEAFGSSEELLFGEWEKIKGKYKLSICLCGKECIIKGDEIICPGGIHGL